MGYPTVNSKTFTGKFNYSPYANNENIFVVLPNGVEPGCKAYVFTTWTQNAAGVQKSPYAQVKNVISYPPGYAYFYIGTHDTAAYYWWRATVQDGGNKIKLEMYSPREVGPVATTIVEKLD